MTFVLLLVFFIILIFFVLPRLMWRFMLHRVRRKTHEFFGSQTSGSQRRSYTDARAPRHRRKKIDPDVGEYVDFEDVPVYKDPAADASVGASYTVKYEVEEQIEDIEWEDIDK